MDSNVMHLSENKYLSFKEDLRGANENGLSSEKTLCAKANVLPSKLQLLIFQQWLSKSLNYSLDVYDFANC